MRGGEIDKMVMCILSACVSLGYIILGSKYGSKLWTACGLVWMCDSVAFLVDWLSK